MGPRKLVKRRFLTKINWWLSIAVILSATGFIDASLAQSVELSNSNKINNIELNGDYLKGYFEDTKSILTSPSRWDKTDWIKASVIVGITVGLYHYDQEIQDWAQRNRNKASNEIAKYANAFGDGEYILPTLGVFYLYSHIFEDKKLKKTALIGLESFVVSGIFVTAIKFTGHRHRPSAGDPYNTWDGPGFSTSHLSFPSGHSSSAFAIATVIASEYEDKVLVPPLAYGIATLTALSRINDNDHWASDVFFGSAIGYFTAKAIVNLHNNKKDKNLIILPVTNDRYTAILVSYKF